MWTNIQQPSSPAPYSSSKLMNLHTSCLNELLDVYKLFYIFNCHRKNYKSFVKSNKTNLSLSMNKFKLLAYSWWNVKNILILILIEYNWITNAPAVHVKHSLKDQNHNILFNNRKAKAISYLLLKPYKHLYLFSPLNKLSIDI